MLPLSHWETCLPVSKRGHARALQIRPIGEFSVERLGR